LTNKHVADLSNGNLFFAPAAENDSQFPYGTFSEKDTQAYPGDADIVLVHLNKNDDGQSVAVVVEPATIQDASTVSKDNPIRVTGYPGDKRSEEHTSELQSRFDLVCRLLLEKKKKT